MLDIRQRVLGPEHPDTLHASTSLWWAAGNAGRHAEAAEQLRRVLQTIDGCLGPST